jgi:hypothetical protein
MRAHSSPCNRLSAQQGPHSPIGRGSGLKIRRVSVRVRLGARRRRWETNDLLVGLFDRQYHYLYVQDSLSKPARSRVGQTLVPRLDMSIANMKVYLDGLTGQSEEELLRVQTALCTQYRALC